MSRLSRGVYSLGVVVIMRADGELFINSQCFIVGVMSYKSGPEQNTVLSRPEQTYPHKHPYGWYS